MSYQIRDPDKIVDDWQIEEIAREFPSEYYDDFCVELDINRDRRQTFLKESDDDYDNAVKRAMGQWKLEKGENATRGCMRDALQAANLGEDWSNILDKDENLDEDVHEDFEEDSDDEVDGEEEDGMENDDGNEEGTGDQNDQDYAARRDVSQSGANVSITNSGSITGSNIVGQQTNINQPVVNNYETLVHNSEPGPVQIIARNSTSAPAKRKRQAASVGKAKKKRQARIPSGPPKKKAKASAGVRRPTKTTASQSTSGTKSKKKPQGRTPSGPPKKTATASAGVRRPTKTTASKSTSGTKSKKKLQARIPSGTSKKKAKASAAMRRR